MSRPRKHRRLDPVLRDRERLRQQMQSISDAANAQENVCTLSCTVHRAWGFAEEFFTERQAINAHQEWVDVCARNDAAPEADKVTCLNCQQRVLKEFYNADETICCFCDQVSNPYLANPINRLWVYLYLPEYERIIFPRHSKCY